MLKMLQTQLVQSTDQKNTSEKMTETKFTFQNMSLLNNLNIDTAQKSKMVWNETFNLQIRLVQLKDKEKAKHNSQNENVRTY